MEVIKQKTEKINISENSLQSNPSVNQKQGSTDPKRKLSVNMLLMIIISLISIGIAGYFGYENSKLRSENIKLKSQINNFTPLALKPTITPIFTDASKPSNTYTQTSDWKVYKNSDWGIEFEYPNENFEITESVSEIFIGFKKPQYVPYVTITKKDTINLNSLKFCIEIHDPNAIFPCLSNSDSGLNSNQIGVISYQIDKLTATSAFIYKGGFEKFYRIAQIKDKMIQLEFYTTPNRFVPASNHTLATLKFN
jgi:hypothetical protein